VEKENPPQPTHLPPHPPTHHPMKRPASNIMKAAVMKKRMKVMGAALRKQRSRAKHADEMKPTLEGGCVRSIFDDGLADTQTMLVILLAGRDRAALRIVSTKFRDLGDKLRAMMKPNDDKKCVTHERLVRTCLQCQESASMEVFDRVLFWTPWVQYHEVKRAGSLDLSHFKSTYDLIPPHHRTKALGWVFFGLSDKSILHHTFTKIPEAPGSGWIAEVLWFQRRFSQGTPPPFTSVKCVGLSFKACEEG
jgi:hypothetical protein